MALVSRSTVPTIPALSTLPSPRHRGLLQSNVGEGTGLKGEAAPPIVTPRGDGALPRGLAPTGAPLARCRHFSTICHLLSSSGWSWSSTAGPSKTAAGKLGSSSSLAWTTSSPRLPWASLFLRPATTIWHRFSKSCLILCIIRAVAASTSCHVLGRRTTLGWGPG